jgi:predicted O-linked N-acetylglucosamine transferase (SPINDLY family)
VKPISRNLPQPEAAASNLPATQAQARFKEGFALHNIGQLAQAQAIYHQALKLQPRHFDSLHMLGVLAGQTNNPTQAVEWISKAIEVNPNIASAYSNLGNALNALKRHQAAIASYDKAIAIKPDYANAYASRGKAWYELKQYQAAVASYDKAIAIKPDHADAYCDRGAALKELKLHQAAIASFDKAMAIKPDHALACCNCGVAWYELKQYQAAIDRYDRAIAIAPDYADAYANRAAALIELKQYQAAVHSYDRAIALRPGYEFLYGRRLHTRMRICDWSDTKNQVTELIQRIQRREKASPPFPVLALSAALPLQRIAAEIHVNQNHPARLELGRISKRSNGEKIRIGYFSADYHNHATAYLMAELFAQHDRSRFELVAFSFGPDMADEMRTRIVAAFDKFIDVRHQSDKEVALLSRRLGVDIAVDLKGFTQDERAGIFAYRAAPLQVNYLGYPGTMGADYMDYLIADKTLIPETSQQHYAEKIAYLPNSYQVNDTQRRISDKVFTREELGLPRSGFVFCCFNNNYKITPSTFDGWMRILNQVEGSILWLIEDNPTAASNLRREAEQRGVNPERLVFANRLPMPDHLARHRAADLFIDTLPYNAHTTASDALWSGLPVLTCSGEAFASRVAASLLTAIDLPELITTTQEEYEALAVELATNPERLKAIKKKLERNRLTTPLFDTKLFTKHIEDAYSQMVERYQANLAPDHIYVGKPSA